MEVIWRLKKPQISLFLMSFNHHAFSPKKKNPYYSFTVSIIILLPSDLSAILATHLG